MLWRVYAHAFRAESLRGKCEVLRDDAFVQDALIVVDIVDEHVQRLNALLETSFQPVPLLGAYYTRHHVEWQDALTSSGVAVNVERDAHQHQVAFCRLLPALELAIFKRLDALYQRLRVWPWLAVRLHQLVVEAVCLIVVEVHMFSRRRLVASCHQCIVVMLQGLAPGTGFEPATR